MGLFGPSPKQILGDENTWRWYLQNAGADLNWLYTPVPVELKLGSQNITHNFVLGNICRFNACKRPRCVKNYDNFLSQLASRALSKTAYYSEGPEQVLKKREVLDQRDVPQPAKHFLLLNKEDLGNPIPSIYENGLWPLDLLGEEIAYWADVHNTGNRLLYNTQLCEIGALDAALNLADWPAACFWGEIDVQNFAYHFNRNSLLIRDAYRNLVPTTKIKIKVQEAKMRNRSHLNVYIPFVGGFQVPTGRKHEFVVLDHVLVDLQGQEHLHTRRLLSAPAEDALEIFTHAAESLEPVKLEDLMALQDFAMQKGLSSFIINF